MSKRTHAALLGALTALTIAPAGLALAQGEILQAPTSAKHHKLREKFEAANTTHDGRLTVAQASAGRMPKVVQNFGLIDADHKGYVTIRDIKMFRRSQRGASQAQ